MFLSLRVRPTQLCHNNSILSAFPLPADIIPGSSGGIQTYGSPSPVGVSEPLDHRAGQGQEVDSNQRSGWYHTMRREGRGRGQTHLALVPTQ